MKNCCFTGHRPLFFPWGDNIKDIRAQNLLSALKQEIRQTIEDKYTNFLWGGALGIDTWAAMCVTELKGEFPNISLTAVLPFEGYNDFVEDSEYHNLIKTSDFRIITGTKRGVTAFTARDRYMIDRSSRIIAVYDERSGIKSGTYRTLQYAKNKKLEVRQIKWLDFCPLVNDMYITESIPK